MDEKIGQSRYVRNYSLKDNSGHLRIQGRNVKLTLFDNRFQGLKLMLVQGLQKLPWASYFLASLA